MLIPMHSLLNYLLRKYADCLSGIIQFQPQREKYPAAQNAVDQTHEIGDKTTSAKTIVVFTSEDPRLHQDMFFRWLAFMGIFLDCAATAR